jgi:hypothetical protein
VSDTYIGSKTYIYIVCRIRREKNKLGTIFLQGFALICTKFFYECSHNESTGYVQRSLNLSAYTGRTVTVKFLGVEDSSLATSFLVDDTSLTTG